MPSAWTAVAEFAAKGATVSAKAKVIKGKAKGSAAKGNGDASGSSQNHYDGFSNKVKKQRLPRFGVAISCKLLILQLHLLLFIRIF